MQSKVGTILLVIAALIAAATAIMHLSCIALGPACFEAQMAPPFIVQSAIDGTWIAPAGTLLISVLFLLAGAYALSRAKLIPKLPLTTWAMYVLGTMCVIRGILPLQLELRHPDRMDTAGLVAGWIWLFVGLMYLVGHALLKRAGR